MQCTEVEEKRLKGMFFSYNVVSHQPWLRPCQTVKLGRSCYAATYMMAAYNMGLESVAEVAD